MLIFLDIDGVMVPSTGWRVPENLDDGFPAFTKNATNALHEFISGFPNGALQVILSTSHRDRFTIQEWKSIFERRGLTIVNLGRLAPNKDLMKKRNEEILEWFNMNPWPDDFLIIDDDKSLNILPPNLKEHLVLTSSSVGLRPDDLSVVA